MDLDTTTEGVEQLALHHEALARADETAVAWLRRRDLDASRLVLSAERATLTAATLRGLARERDAAEERAERAGIDLQAAREDLARAEAEKPEGRR